MRDEASPKQWERLYEVTCNLKALEPWKYFWDTQLVAIFLQDSEEPVFVSIMGCGGNCYGVSVYEGLEGLRDFDMIASTEETGLPPEYAQIRALYTGCTGGGGTHGNFSESVHGSACCERRKDFCGLG